MKSEAHRGKIRVRPDAANTWCREAGGVREPKAASRTDTPSERRGGGGLRRVPADRTAPGSQASDDLSSTAVELYWLPLGGPHRPEGA
jgi:hypothetical protein